MLVKGASGEIYKYWHRRHNLVLLLEWRITQATIRLHTSTQWSGCFPLSRSFQKCDVLHVWICFWNIRWYCIFFHFSTLTWRRLLKSYLVEHSVPLISNNSMIANGLVMKGTRAAVAFDIDLVCQGYSNVRRVQKPFHKRFMNSESNSQKWKKVWSCRATIVYKWLRNYNHKLAETLCQMCPRGSRVWSLKW